MPDRWDLSVSIQGAPIGVVPYRTDLGSLGLLTNAQAVALTDSFFQAYQSIPTTTIRFQNQGPILSLGTPGSPPAGQPVDVNSTNFAPYLMSSTPIGQNIIVFDADGSIFDALFGVGTGVLGFVSPTFVFSAKPFFFEALAAYNGRFLEGNAANGELAVNEFRGVFTHETGHFVGLDHSQVNGQIASRMVGGIRPSGFTDAQLFDLYAPFGESVFPFLFSAPAGSVLAANGFPNSGFFIATLALDEVIATSNLYPAPGFLPGAGSPFGAISGAIFSSDGTTPVSGVNVVARRIDQGPFPPPPSTLAYPPSGVPPTDADGVPLPPPAQAATDSLATAASVVSGRIGPGFAPGPAVTPGNGTFQINGLPPGKYLVAIESIDLAFVSGSRIGQFQPPLQLVMEEYYNGPRESDDPRVDDPHDFVPVTVIAGQVTSRINFILNRIPSINETEPNDTLSQANPITPPTTVAGTISPSTDSDVYSFTGNAGDVVAASVRAQRLTPASTLSPVLELLASDGTVLATNDDTFGLDSFLQFRLPSSGTFFVRIRSFQGSSSGPYQVDVSFVNPLPVAKMTDRRADLDGDGRSDIVWRHSDGRVYGWQMNGLSIGPSGQILALADTSWKIVGMGDFNGDGKADLFWRRGGSGETYVWFMNGLNIAGATAGVTVADSNWKVERIADFDGDGRADLLWRNAVSGEVDVWLMNWATITAAGSPFTVPDANWKIVGVGDFDGDGKADVLWRHAVTGATYLWFMNGLAIRSSAPGFTVPDPNWVVEGVGDFDGDEKADVLWRHAVTGQVYVWLMSGAAITAAGSPFTVPDANWKIVGVGDFDGDGKADVLWRHAVTGQLYVWLMNGLTMSSSGSPATVADLGWSVQNPR